MGIVNLDPFAKNYPSQPADQKMDIVCDDSLLLMCKDAAVYNITQNIKLNESLLPGCIKYGTLSYSQWMKTRYSAGSNVSARRLMLRAFGTDNHNNTLKITRALSLSDCYWLKQQSENVFFSEVTPYLNKEWDGSGVFTGGSISTLFVNGAADKRWLDSNTLLKVNSYKELEPYALCHALGLEEYCARASMSKEGLLVSNFTSTDFFLESMEQSGIIGEEDNPMEKAVELFKEQAAALFVIDYLVEHDDRHWGNFGFIRDTETGKYSGMAPYYDFDWAWSGGVVPLPKTAMQRYGGFLNSLCEKAASVDDSFEHKAVISKRAAELMRMVNGTVSISPRRCQSH